MAFRSFYPLPYIGAELSVLQQVGNLAGRTHCTITGAGRHSWAVKWGDGSEGTIYPEDIQYLCALNEERVKREFQPVRVNVRHSFFVREVEDGRKVYNILPTGEVWNGDGYFDREHILKLKGYDPNEKDFFTSVK